MVVHSSSVSGTHESMLMVVGLTSSKSDIDCPLLRGGVSAFFFGVAVGDAEIAVM